MKKNVFGRKFNRDTNERKALFKSLISSLVLKERIKTTEPKAKAIKADVDKIITKVKKNGTEAEKFGRARLLDKRGLSLEVQTKLIKDIVPRFKERNGGYTRIIRIGRRFGDNAMEVIMEWTERSSVLSSPLSDKGQSVVGKPVNRKRVNRKPKTENRKPRIKK